MILLTIESFYQPFLLQAKFIILLGKSERRLVFKLKGVPISETTTRIPITDIGYGRNQLVCVTSGVSRRCCLNNEAYWTYPNGNRVPTTSLLEHIRNFSSTPGNNEIHLSRRPNASGPTGLYKCVVQLPNKSIVRRSIMITGAKFSSNLSFVCTTFFPQILKLDKNPLKYFTLLSLS